MKVSRANLLVREVASADKNDPAINGVHVASDGTTVAANGRMLMAVEPAPKLYFPDVGVEPEIPDQGLTVPLQVIDKALSNLPKDKRAATQQAAITQTGEEGGTGGVSGVSGVVELTTVSKSTVDRVAGNVVRQKFPEWEGVLREARERADTTRVCVNRRDLIQLLQAMERACPDPGNKNAVFIELGGQTDPLLVRAMNLQTGQHAVGLMSPLDTHGDWMPANKWEKKLFSGERDTEQAPEGELSSVPLRRKRVIRKVKVTGKHKIVRKLNKKASDLYD